VSNERISEIVTDFSEKVANFAVQAEAAKATQKVVKALTALSDAIGSETVEAGQVTLNGDELAEAAEVLKERELDFTDIRNELVKSAKTVQVFKESEVLEEDDSDIADKALVLWETVKPSAVVRFAQKGESVQNRQSNPDFAFPIYAKCELCGETVRTGERSGVTDWNSLRHYAQRHGQNVHVAPEFRSDSNVQNAWLAAKAAFESGMTEVSVSGNDQIPGFDLIAQSA
jgi:hypothetical protein